MCELRILTSNLYIQIELIDFVLSMLQTREYKTHDNIYGKKVFYIAFSDDCIAYWRNGRHHRPGQQFCSRIFLNEKKKPQPQQRLGVGSNSQYHGKRNKMT